MKKYLLFLIFLSSGKLVPLFAQQNQFTDPRDGRTYKTVEIGEQLWFAENLKIKTSNGNYFSYNNDPGYVNLYGYLYDWKTACDVCPSGWRLASNDDWRILTNYIGDDPTYKSKLMSKVIWDVSENATNVVGFSGLPGGLRDHLGTYRNKGVGAYFWSSTPQDQNFAYARELGKNAGNYASHLFGTNKNMGLSVRCVQDLSPYIEEEIDQSEYEESAYEEPETPQYEESYSIQKSVKQYSVFKTQTCNEKQDLYYNYMGEFECEPIKSANIKITINIHLSDPMYDEATVTMYDVIKKSTDEFPIEFVELLEGGELLFHFSVINQPHTFLLDESNKKLSWYSEWGHWQEEYFFK